MLKYLLGIFLSLSISVFASTGGKYTQHVTYPDDANFPTDAVCANHATDSEVQLIDEDSDWTTINDANVYYYCVEPGDYTAQGTISITKSCTAEQKCYIRYYNTAETYEAHPVDMEEADRVKINEIHWLDLSTVPAKYWVADRLWVARSYGNSSVRMQGGDAENITWNRGLIENSGGGAGMMATGGDNLLIQGTVFRNSFNNVGTDDHCIAISGDDIQVLNNESYDCRADSYEFVSSGGTFAGNEGYVTSALWSDCAGNIDITGDCYCVENAMGFKGAGSGSFPWSTSTEMSVRENFMWGYSRDDDGGPSGCGGTGVGSRGLTMGWNAGGDGARIEDNVFWEGPSPKESAPFVMTSASPNVDYVEGTLFKNVLIVGFEYFGSFNNTMARNNQFIYTTWQNIDIQWMFANEDNNDYNCNVLMNVPEHGADGASTGSVFDVNAYFNSDRDVTHQGPDDLVVAFDIESKNETFCVPRYHITGMEAKCFPLAVTTKESPHGDICNSPPETAGRGMSNTPELTRVRAGFIGWPLERTMEYEESEPLVINGENGRQFTFVAPVEDFYEIWFKVTTTDETDNSLSFSFDGTSGQVVAFDYPVTEWRKAKTNAFLGHGLHTITVIEREDGIDIDKILITNNKDFVSP